MLNEIFKMAVSSSKPKFLSVLRRVEFSLNNGNFPSLNLKHLQMKCFEYMLEGQDVTGVLPTFPAPPPSQGKGPGNEVDKKKKKSVRKKRKY